MSKRKVEQTVIEAGETKIPAKIYREIRRDVRFSIARKGAILRMPILLPPHDQKREVQNFRDWVRKQLASNEKLQEHFSFKEYRTGDTLQVGKRTYLINVEKTDNKSHSARLMDDTIHLRLAAASNEMNTRKAVRHLLSRVVSQHFLPQVTSRVLELNQLHFQKPIRSVNLKYNLSNWGSCSNKGNINLSSRLLFAPGEVLDYVIIHELAHLVEMNHSSRYWDIVQRIMPDFKSHEAWLKKNWHLCDF